MIDGAHSTDPTLRTTAAVDSKDDCRSTPPTVDPPVVNPSDMTTLSTTTSKTSTKFKGPIDPRLWKASAPARGYILLSTAMSAVVALVTVVFTVALARILAGIAADQSRLSLNAWRVELVVLGAAIAIRAIVSWVHRRYAHRAAGRVIEDLRTQLLMAAARIPPRQLNKYREELIVVATSGLHGLRPYLIDFIPSVMAVGTVTPIVLIAIMWADVPSGLIILVTLPLIPFFMWLIGTLTQERTEEHLRATTRLTGTMLDLVAGLPTLAGLGRQHGAEQQIERLARTHKRKTMQSLRIAFLSGAVLDFLATLCVALVAVSIGMRLVGGHISLFPGIVALVLAADAYMPLRSVGQHFHDSEDGLLASDRAFGLLDKARDYDSDFARLCTRRLGAPVLSAPGSDSPSSRGSGSDSPSSNAPNFATHRLFPLKKRDPKPTHTPLQSKRDQTTSGRVKLHLTTEGPTVTVSDLSVPARQFLAPDHLSFTAAPGKITVLSGRNGTGKSTTIQAILGLPEQGQSGFIAINNTPIDDIDLTDYWLHVGWLPQNPALLPHLADGDELSRGQQQRLALTRIWSQNPSLILFDEPTAHLDVDNEVKVLQEIRRRTDTGATAILISHRPAVLDAADQVITVSTSTPTDEP